MSTTKRKPTRKKSSKAKASGLFKVEAISLTATVRRKGKYDDLRP